MWLCGNIDVMSAKPDQSGNIWLNISCCGNTQKQKEKYRNRRKHTDRRKHTETEGNAQKQKETHRNKWKHTETERNIQPKKKEIGNGGML